MSLKNLSELLAKAMEEQVELAALKNRATASSKPRISSATITQPEHGMELVSFDNNSRYLQLAFNDDLRTALTVLPRVIRDPRIMLEAGTPFIKSEGMAGVRAVANMAPGIVVADMKVADGAADEVLMAKTAGARAITVLGSSPVETLRLFIETCKQLGMISMIDMLGVEDPLQVMRPLYTPPDVVVIHRGRDEESNRAKMIRYRHISRIRSKYDVMISAAGGVDQREARSAVFNGANIVVVNVVKPEHSWNGIRTTDDITALTQQFLETIA